MKQIYHLLSAYTQPTIKRWVVTTKISKYSFLDIRIEKPSFLHQEQAYTVNILWGKWNIR